MKKFLFALLAFAILSFTACERVEVDSGDDKVVPPVQKADTLFYEIISDENHGLLSFADQLLSGENSSLAAYKGLILPQVENLLNSVRKKNGLTDEEIGFRKVAFRYRSIGLDRDSVVLSAAAFWMGYYSSGRWHDLAPKDLCLLEHFTVTADSECPSVGYPFEMFSAGNNLTVMPDYLGYAESGDMVHPYMIHDLCAANSIDALPAAMKIFGHLSEKDLSKGWSLTVKGASQGGGNALAVHKKMDTDPALADKWNFKGSYCAAGPYSPSLTVEKYLEAGKTDSPVLFTLTLSSMHHAYPEIFGRFAEDRIYSAKYMAAKDQIDAAFRSREKNVSQMNSMLMKFLKDYSDSSVGAGQVALSDILSEEILDRNSEVFKALYQCLQANDLTVGWAPVRPIRLYYSTADTTVPYENAIAVSEAFGDDDVTLEKGMGVNHTMCCALWMLNVLMESYSN